MKFRRTMLAAALAASAIALTACGGSGGTTTTTNPSVADAPKFDEGTTMAKIAKAGKLRVGTKFDQPGFGLKGLSGAPEGFDVEVAKIIAGALGISPDNIEYTETPSKVREQVIDNGDVDLVAATYTINDERKKLITFAGPYYEAGQQLMVAADDDSIKGPDDLRNAAIKVCSVDGSTPAENIKQYLADPAQLVTFDVYDKCADALETGQVQVVTTDNVILLGFVSKSEGKFKLVGDQFTEEPYGIGIAKGDIPFCEFINTTLKANQDAYNNAWASTAGKIKGTQAPALPAADACS